VSSEDFARVAAASARYVEARKALLAELELGRDSNRDPLAEFAEWLGAGILGGERALTPVQAEWDVETPAGQHVQVKYLANSGDRWVNEHSVRITPAMDADAIVFYDALMPVAVVLMPARRLAEIGQALGNRHPNQETTLQLTRQNYLRLLGDPVVFGALGVPSLARPRLERGHRMSKYDPLLAYLAAHPGELTVSIDAIAKLVGGLPRSAERWAAAWWANDATHVQAHAWLDCGHRVERVDLARGIVRFS
jgi:hypothetical protein